MTDEYQAPVAKIATRESYVQRLIVVDGVMRAGKFIYDALVSHLEDAEMWQQYPIIDSIPILHGLGRLDDDLAINLLRRELDMHLYYGLLGRRSNFRFADRSSIWHSRDPAMYFKRIFSDSEAEILEQLDEIRPIFCLSTHDVMCNAGILFDAFPDLKIISCRRNPLDLAYSWHKKNWGNRIGSEPRSLWLAFETSSGSIPWHAIDWADEYQKMRPMDRIIHGISWLNSRMDATYQGLSKKRRDNILISLFEHTVSETQDYVETLCQHVGSSPSWTMERSMHDENVPRILSRGDFEMRRAEIEQHASPQAFAKLLDMVDAYNMNSINEFGIDTQALRTMEL